MNDNPTINEAIEMMRERNANPVKIASGYCLIRGEGIDRKETYFLCKCSGDYPFSECHCICGQEFFACDDCKEKGEILCIRCSQSPIRYLEKRQQRLEQEFKDEFGEPNE